MILPLQTRRPARHGFTLIDSAISIVLFATLMGGFLMSFLGLGRMTDTSEAEYQLVVRSQRGGHLALP